MKKLLFAMILLLVFFTPLVFSYRAKVIDDREKAEEASIIAAQTPYDYQNACAVLTEASGRNIPRQFLESLERETVDSMVAQAEQGIKPITVNGETLNVMFSRFTGEIDGKTVIDLGSNGNSYFELGFGGDINFTSGDYIMPHAETFVNGVLDCIDSEFKDAMKTVDVMMLNNEFTYSKRGTPTPNKQFTFRADPSSVKYLNLLGVDIVSLANNHTYDYGSESFQDTLETLDNAAIPYVGAGNNIEEASRSVSYIINGCKVAYLAASRAENLRLTPLATISSEGVCSCYGDSEEFIETIEKTAAKNDYVIVYVHWGTEYSTDLQNAQKELARKYIDAGADAVIGAHPHILQGIEFYNGKPVVYSLGNFLFSTKTLDSGMAVLKIEGENIGLRFIPGRQINSELKYMKIETERKILFNRLISISPSPIKIDSDGNVTEDK
ncbi:MAG: CapA family protein [Clostridia bacterium]|nr:CapA family protein [Clostridia bacterium]